MDYIRGVNRGQVMLFPESVEDYITEDNPVRFIDAFVSSLDLAQLGFTRAHPAETGRPAYDPGDLLRRVPVVFTNQEVNQVIQNLSGVYFLIAGLMYGSGLRLMECLRLRVKDIDFSYNQVWVRHGKGAKD